MMPKPRLRWDRWLRCWVCGVPGDSFMWWAMDPKPAKAYELWARAQEKAE
jgi:hypothetical protein